MECVKNANIKNRKLLIMKKIIKNLEKQLELLIEYIENREIIFDYRSEKWQESEKGKFFQNQTDEIEYKLEKLDTIIDELKELL